MSNVQDKKNKRVVGVVSSAAMDKTCVIKIRLKVKHPLLGKYINRESTMYVHDEGNEAQLGDEVLVQLMRPVSKKKKWILIEVVKKASVR